jgi:hypothetical protein
MRQSYNLDGLIDYGTDCVPETTMVVNPAYRALDGQVRKKLGMLNRKIAEFGAMNLEGEIEPSKVEAFAQRKSDLQETITQLQKVVDPSPPACQPVFRRCCQPPLCRACGGQAYCRSDRCGSADHRSVSFPLGGL